MRAIRYNGAGGTGVIELVDTERPEPGDGEVLIAVTAAGINRADISQREGHYPPPAGVTDIPGLEVSGVVAAVGRSVTGHAVGDRVCALLAGGGYADYVTVPVELVLAVPDTLDLVAAAALPEALATVYSCLHRAAGMRAGDTVLVHGAAGGIGSVALQLARAAGARVIATASGRFDELRDLGADEVVDYRQDWVARVNELGGADIVLDIIGASYLERNLDALRIGGRIVVIGQQGGERAAPLDLARLMSRRQTVIGLTLRSRPPGEKADIMRGVRDDIWPLVLADSVRPVVDGTYDLADAAAAQRDMTGSHLGKLLLTTAPTPSP